MDGIDKRELGLIEKFIVTRVDGKSAEGEKHHKCRYFVLDLDHDEFSAIALRAYALRCSAKYPKLAHDLFTVADEISEKKVE